MTSLTIVWDDEDNSVEGIENWIDALIEKKLITAGFVSRILINNKEFMDRERISQSSQWFEKLLRNSQEGKNDEVCC